MNNKVRISDIQPNPKEAGIWLNPTTNDVKKYDSDKKEFVGG